MWSFNRLINIINRVNRQVGGVVWWRFRWLDHNLRLELEIKHTSKTLKREELAIILHCLIKHSQQWGSWLRYPKDGLVLIGARFTRKWFSIHFGLDTPNCSLLFLCLFVSGTARYVLHGEHCLAAWFMGLHRIWRQSLASMQRTWVHWNSILV